MAVEELLAQLFVVFVVAKGLGAVAERLHAPSLVGEILAGVLLGVPLLRGALHLDAGMEVLHFLAEVGVVFLLFGVGLETPLHELARVGRTSMAVALSGVAVPLAAGYGLGILLGYQGPAALFLGVALVATSVGITAKLLADRGLLEHRVARIIVGAAVIDDVVGLIVLAVARGIATGGALPLADLVAVVALALGFVGAVLAFGPRLVRTSLRLVARKAEEGARDGVVALAIGVCLGLSALAAVFGLAALVGAFFAGMAFAQYRERFHLEQAFRPLVLLLTPVFFAFIGLQIDLAAARSALGVALVVTLVAVLTKWIPCALAARSLGRPGALAVGAGMVPRGEVGIIVALVGLTAGIVTTELYAVVVTMALLTTIVGPPLLDALLKRTLAAEAAARRA